MKINLKKSAKYIALSAVSLLSLATVAPVVNASATSPAVNTSAHAYQHVYHIARTKLGDRYVYGATGPRRFDCSGYTKYIFGHGAHAELPRTAQAQYNDNTHARHAAKGELVFFGGSKHSISHVGMCIGHGKMIDAQNRGVVTENIHAPWWHRVGYAKVLK